MDAKRQNGFIKNLMETETIDVANELKTIIENRKNSQPHIQGRQGGVLILKFCLIQSLDKISLTSNDDQPFCDFLS